MALLARIICNRHVAWIAMALCFGIAAPGWSQCAIHLAMISQNAHYQKADGSLTAIASDGKGSYTYKWSDGFAGPTHSHLAPGIYKVTATDSASCSQETSGAVITKAAACDSCLEAPPDQLAKLITYFTELYNPKIGLMSVDKQLTCNGPCKGVSFSYMDGSGPAPIVPEGARFLPFESRINAAGLAGMGLYPDMVSSIFKSIQGLYASVNWHPSWNRESMIGVIIPYKIGNKNWTFTPTGGAPYPVLNGFTYQLDQAAPWDVVAKKWKPDTTRPEQGIVDPAQPFTKFIDGTLFQAVNLYLRGDTVHAKGNLQAVANQCTVNSDGSVGFGTAPYRGMFLGTFLETVEIVGTPELKEGCGLQAIQKTLWALQLPDGGISRTYSCVRGAGCEKLNSTDETTNAALLVYSPGLIKYIQQVARSGKFNLDSKADAHIVIEQEISKGFNEAR
ncbi:MAG: SprB repeat-containing protein [Acidobacteriota bacterium]